MKLSKLNEIPSTREMISAFRGYNHNIRISEGEFYDMKNLTSDEYPNLSPRKKRGIYATEDFCNDDMCSCEFQGMISKDSLWYVFGGNLYENHEKIENFELDPIGKKTLISMGAYIIIMPDKKYINTASTLDRGNIEENVELKTGRVDLTPCQKDGIPFYQPESLGSEEIKEQATPPTASDYNLETLPNKTYWIDTSDKKQYLFKSYDADDETWVEVKTYVRLRFLGDGRGPFKRLNVGDVVSISGIGYEHAKRLFDGVSLEIISKDMIHFQLVFDVSLNRTIEQNCVDNPITITRAMPDMDFVIESGNRLWGCKYGEKHGTVINEIYASKLGDFKNWNCFSGISTDSYAVTVGTSGEFTGAISYLGYPLFFKEDYIHKVYGNFPSNFQVQTTACRGVQKESSDSLALVNETLYYKSRYSVCAYDGALPVEMSAALGNVQYSYAVAGSFGNKYYISMKDSEDYHLFVYDTYKGMWHKEDNTEATQFCQHKGSLYYIDRDVRQIRSVQTVSSVDGEVEPNPIEWSAETGIIGVDTPGKKYVSRLVIRMLLHTGTSVRVFANYDSSNVWEQLFTMTNSNNLRTYSVPIKTTRCDHFRLRITGEGEAQIFSIAKTIEEGSDL